MNAHHEEWLGSKKTDIHGVCAFEFAVLNNNLHQQLVDAPTRFSPKGDDSKLDLFLTTSPDNHVVTVDAPFGQSDHGVVSTLANYHLPAPSFAGKLNKVWLYDRADWDGMRSFLADVKWTPTSTGLSADAAWACVKDNNHSRCHGLLHSI